MKKLALLCLFLIVLSFVGCTANQPMLPISDALVLTVQTAPITTQTDCITLEIANSTDRELTYGPADLVLQRKTNQTFTDVNMSGDLLNIASRLPAHHTNTETFDLRKRNDGTLLQPGTYRFCLVNAQDNLLYVSPEFTVTE